MEIANEVAHQTLAYLAVATRGGGLTAKQLDSYAFSPHPIAPKYRDSFYTAVSASIAESILGKRQLVSPGEVMSAYLQRVDWAAVQDGLLRITNLGKAVLGELNNPRIEISSDDPISVIVDPEDPLAWARIFDRIASVEDALLVDPYLAPAQFFELLEVPGVTRILMSDNKINAKRPAFSQGLRAFPTPPEVRYLPDRLHDRFLIPEVGEILVFGSSLNSITKRPGVVTPITDPAAAEAIREAYRDLWAKGTAIEPAPVSPSSSDRVE